VSVGVNPIEALPEAAFVVHRCLPSRDEGHARSDIIRLVLAMARAELRPLGRALMQSMIV
jgi:hypothetical protein